DDTVSVIETSNNSVIATIPVGDGPQGIAITPDDQFIYVVNAIDTFVSVIRTSDNTVVDEIEVGVGSIALGTFIVPPPPLPPEPVPTLGQWGLIMLVGLLGTIGFIAIRKNRALA
ncbi:MAG: IPTL-CTERM sorting domain-containing protein, partial [Thermodesulfobacteriota bacterium]